MRQTNHKYRHIFFLAIMVSAIISLPKMAYSQDKPDALSSSEQVAVEAYASHDKVAPGETLFVALKLTISPGWHVNSNHPSDEFLIPTEISLDDGAQVVIENTVYPVSKMIRFEFSPDAPLSVYDGAVWIKSVLSVKGDANSGPDSIPLLLTTQACDNKSCVAPLTQTLSIPITIAAEAIKGEFRHGDIFTAIGITTATGPATSSKLPDKGNPSVALTSVNTGFWGMVKNFRADAFVDRFGYILAFIAMYLLGLGLTLTPCVYPIIPITIGYFGSQSSGKWTRQLSMAAVFGLGIAISYAAVGTIAALSGALMGAALQSIWVLIALSLLCFAMGLNAFGVFEITLPGWLSNAAGGGSRRGIAGAAIMGLTMGIAAAPCLAAFIVSLLAFIGQKGDPVLGFSMFFVLGLGLATPFVALGTFSGLISKVPKSGAWMVFAKKVMGALLFAAALYFLNPVLPKPLLHSIVGVALTAAGLYFGFFESTPAKSWRFRAVRYLFAIIFIGGAVWWGMPSEKAVAESGIAWQSYSAETVQQAASKKQPVIIDFYADWCIPCKELDKMSFSDPRVVEASKGIILLKANLTQGSEPEVKKIISQYGIKGVPTVVFIASDGLEIQDLRINQFEKADFVLNNFNALRSAEAKVAATGSPGQ